MLRPGAPANPAESIRFSIVILKFLRFKGAVHGNERRTALISSSAQ